MLEEVALSVIDDVLSAGQSMIEACMLPGLDPLERVLGRNGPGWQNFGLPDWAPLLRTGAAK